MDPLNADTHEAAPEWAQLDAVPRLDYADVPGHVAEQATGRRWLVTLDGRSGAGKTHLTKLLTNRHPDVQVLHLDDLYRDWDALACGLVRARHIVEQWSRRNRSTYVPTHWPGTAARGRSVVVPDRPLLVEGVGSTWVGRRLANTAIWLEAPRDARCTRALERDGETFAPYWLAWEKQENAWFATHPPRPDVVVTVELPGEATGQAHSSA